MSDDVTMTSGLDDAVRRPQYDLSEIDLVRLMRLQAWPRVVGIGAVATGDRVNRLTRSRQRHCSSPTGRATA